MPRFTQDNRPMAISTPLGKDVMLLVSMTGQEGLSQVFDFQLETVAENETAVPFENLLGASITARIDSPKGRRFFNGICNRVSQGGSDADFTGYTIGIVPQCWFLTRRANSRIFERQSVPDILKKVLQGIKVRFDLRGTFEPRDYCVQYRETDYNFACRVMEEEGIFFLFTHADGSHEMVVADHPDAHPALPGGESVTFDTNAQSGKTEGNRLFTWVKRQEVRSGKVTLRDHAFELAHNPLEATKSIQGSVQVGKVTHKLTVANNGQLELYDYPGEYAQRFDGIAPGGGEQPDKLNKVFADKDRTAAIRMQQEAMPSVIVQGAGDCPRLSAGHRFNLDLVAGDKAAARLRAEGKYVLLTVSHLANQSDFRSSGAVSSQYQCTFSALPAAMPFRPLRSTPKPFVQGLQTAVVVGPPGQEIFTDKFGRVKVQFFWDREGQKNIDSSCWMRVAQLWAGKRWGGSFWPRIGQEVIVAFEEGDPDQPIIVGSVYNSEQMPPYLGDGPDGKHKSDNKVSGVKSNSTPGGKGFNEWRFDDTKGKEQVFIHAERDLDLRVKNEARERVLSNSHLIVGGEKDGQKAGDQREMVFKDKHLLVKGDQVEKVEGSMQLLIGGGEGDAGNQDIIIKKIKTEKIEKDSNLEVVGDRKEKIGGGQSLSVGGDQQEKVTGNHLLEASQSIHIKAGMTLILEAGIQLSLKVGGNFVDLSPAGVAINGSPMVMINSGGAAGSAPDSQPASPDPPKEADPTKPDEADNAVTGFKSAP